MNGNETNDTNKLASSLLNFVEIFKELSMVNQNINNESSKLYNFLIDKNTENDDDLNKIDLIIKTRENELNKLKNL